MEHRSEVDGLRAVAVLPILLFHADFSLFKGGYIGVDVFFVISGYLISSILLTELGENRFSFSRFYERRVRRILPALLMVLGACLLGSWYLLPPEELATFSKSLVSVLLLNSNNHFASLKGYFNLATWRDPLLHTWSLAVEEQYYLIFPLFLTVGWRLRRNVLKSIILALCVLSLLLAEITVHSNPIGAFYRLPTRMWELLIGTLLAWGEWESGPAKLNRWSGLVSLAGLLMIAWAVFYFGPETPHPGLITLVPVLGAALVIRYGRAPGPARRLLRSTPMVTVGLISYSLYLVHQPLFTFFRLTVHDPTTTDSVILISISLVLAFASWKWLESPFRDRKALPFAKIFPWLLATSLTLLLLGQIGVWTQGFPWRFSGEVQKVYAYGTYEPRVARAATREDRCFLELGSTYTDLAGDCLAPGGRAPKVVLWGDSYSASLYSGLAAAYGEGVLGQANASGCPPAQGLVMDQRPNCLAFNDYVLERLLALPPCVIIMGASWGDADFGGYDTPELYKRLAMTVKRLTSKGHTVVVCGTLPVWSPMLRDVVAKMLRDNIAPLPPTITLNSRARLDAVDARVKQAVVPAGASFLPLLPMACDGANCRAYDLVDGEPKLYAFDQAHLTVEGSAYYGPRIRKAIDAMSGKR